MTKGETMKRLSQRMSERMLFNPELEQELEPHRQVLIELKRKKRLNEK